MDAEKCAILVFLVHLFNSESRGNPFVQTDIGLIKGLKADDGDYSMFLGIPFANINVSNPFGMATPHPGFEDTFEAYNDTSYCPQREEYNKTLVGSLDCLKLNIFVPDSATPNNQLPVLAYIYGGTFLDGDYSRYLYGAKFLVKHEIILVTINYRGGPYGFMCLNSPEVPGNQGLKDQVLALRWIKRHIGAFGGDETKITLGGHSAGGISIDFHLKSNSEKLYDKVIIQSGTTFAPVFNKPIETAPIILSDYLGFPTNNTNEAIDYLAKLDTDLIISAAESLGVIDKFKPCVEKEFEGVESFLTNNWLIASTPKVKNMPILFGITSDERCGYHPSEYDEDYENVVKDQIAMLFNVTNDFKDMTDIIHHFYFGDEPASAAVRESVIDFDSDIYFVYPAYKTIERYLDDEAGNIYFLVFSYVGERNFVRILWNATRCKSQHGDDMGYLFDLSYMKHLPITPADQLMIDRMTTIWTNFIKFGNPIPQTSDLFPVEWPPITKQSELPYLEIDDQLKTGSRPFHQRAAFWELFYRAYKHLHIAYPASTSNVDAQHDKHEERVYSKTEL